ncbi:uncharacterized protein [Dermacentor albipictus]|uniref:uncharacterized protein isoform X3 n=1 Tax=Dermacentor albipictus TaxID=60249 RepID=UPI0031FBCA31
MFFRSEDITEMDRRRRYANLLLRRRLSEMTVPSMIVALRVSYGVRDRGAARRSRTRRPTRAAHLSHAQVSDNRALITRTLYAAFDVGTNGSETVLSVDYAQLGSGVTHLNEQKLHFHGHFVVLHADAQCLVLELWKDSDGKSICGVWRPVPSGNIEQSQCQEASAKCMSPMKTLTNNIKKCKEYDAKEQRATAEENKEILASAGS